MKVKSNQSTNYAKHKLLHRHRVQILLITSHWEQVLEDLETAGIESTGSYSGDVQLHSQVMKQVEEMMEQLQEVQSQQELQPQHDETGKIDEKNQSG